MTTCWFAFVIAHPCFLAPDTERTVTAAGAPAAAVGGHFRERFWRSSNPCGVRRAGNFHRTLSTYLNALTRHGLILEKAVEPSADALLAQQQPLYAEVPIFFGARCRSAAR